MLSQMLKPLKLIHFSYNPQVLSEYGPEEFNHLMECVQNVLVEDAIRKNFDAEEHKKFIYIILNELKLAEMNFKDKINDHCLTPDQNRQLRLKIYMCIGNVCLDLFRLYCRKAKELDSRGVYTTIPNNSRARTELATETAKLLDVFAIRHAIKKIETLRWRLSDADLPMRHQYREKKLRHWHVGSTSKQEIFVKNMFQKFFSKYGSSYPGKLYTDYYKYRMQIFELMQGRKRPEDPEIVEESESPSVEIIQAKVPKYQETKRIKRSNSEPRLYFGESIFEELDIQLSAVLKRSQSLAAMHLLPTKIEERQIRDLDKDLRLLAQRDDVQDDVAELLMDDLPPVIKSATQDDKRKQAQAKLQRTIQTLEQLQRENRRIDSKDVKVIEPIFTQPDILTVNFQRKDTVRISSVQVTERSLQVNPTLQIFKPQYNELLGEIPSSIVDEIDQVVDDKHQLEELYENLNTVLEEFENKESFEILSEADDIFEVPDNLNFKFCMNSASLNMKSRIVNEDLKVAEVPPWQGMKREAWELVPQVPRRHQKTTIYPRNPMIVMQDMSDAKRQNEWKTWWLSFFNDKDCLKYLSMMKTDFLHVIFHLYDDENLLEIFRSKEEAERLAATLKMEKEMVAAETERKVEELHKKKSQYEEGFWNAETIFLGGLGSDPSALVSKDSTQIFGDEKTPDIEISSHHDGKDGSPRTPAALSKRSTAATSGVYGPERSSAPAIDEGLAQRMSDVWQALEMPDDRRSKMALRYSTNEQYRSLPKMLTDWEKVVNQIIEREIILSQLEAFERYASDPNRFFVRVAGGSGAMRLREARERSLLYKVSSLEIFPQEVRVYSLFVIGKETFAVEE
ncbi:Hypothetical predicted protein [Octopus vulgaris]|uniref:Coiled-coil domain-containing protein 87-like n=1 Tax=Octopus vulgaris TaxID=6645 RepID=A0AA36BSR9_OCTVU|nr:Hypothetical predicted protein [Octopus vulgaris]